MRKFWLWISICLLVSVCTNVFLVTNNDISYAMDTIVTYDFSEAIKDENTKVIDTIEYSKDGDINSLLDILGINLVTTYSVDDSDVDIVSILDESGYVVIENEDTYTIYEDFASKRLIVRGDLNNYYGATKVIKSHHIDEVILCFGSIEDTKNAYNELSKISDISVYVDMMMTAFTTRTDDENYDYLSWGAETIGVEKYNQYLMDNITSDDEYVSVAVIDSGINTSHELFKNRFILEDNKIVGEAFTKTTLSGAEYEFEDDYHHGTHVSGTIADLTTENVKIIPIKLTGNSQYTNIYNSTVLAVKDWILLNANKYNIVATNMSIAFDSDQKFFSSISSFCTEIKNKGVISVVAAGNSSENVTGKYCFPTNCEDAIVVSALKKYGSTYVYDSSYTNYGTPVDISAPGTAIKSAYIGSSTAYEYSNGTSMATPHVTACVALLSLGGFTDIEDKLYDMAIDLGNPGRDIYYGEGMLSLSSFLGAVPYTANDTVVTYDGAFHNISVSTGSISSTIKYGLTSYDISLNSIEGLEQFKNWTNGAITVYFEITPDPSSNYAVATGQATLTINKRDVTLSIGNKSKFYGDIVDLSDVAVNVSNLVSGEDLGIINLATSITASSNANTSAPIYYSSHTNTNYNVISSSSGTLTVSKRNVSITLLPQERQYGIDTIDNTRYIVSSGDVINNDLGVVLSTVANTNSPIGNYKITLSSYSENYNVLVDNEDNTLLSIIPREIEISISQSGEYGDTPRLNNSDYKVTSTQGIIGEDNLGLTMTTTATSTSPKGNYVISYTWTNENYNVTSTTNNYRVEPRYIVVELEDQEITYGSGEISSDKYTYDPNDVVNRDSLDIILGTYDSNYNPIRVDSKVGAYSIYVKSHNSNYNVHAEISTLTISPRTIYLTISNQSSEYGNSISLSQSGYSIINEKDILTGDILNITLKTDAVANTIGKYDIEASTINANYTLSYDGENKYEVTERNIVIYIYPKSSSYGQDIDLSNGYYISSGSTVYGDTLDIVLSTTATKTSNVGDYPITISSHNEKYSITAQNQANYNITKLKVKVTALDQQGEYGYTPELLQNEYTTNNDYDFDLGIVLTTNATSTSPAYENGKQCKYEINVTTTNGNIEIDEVKGKYIIEPREIEITVENKTYIYGDEISVKNISINVVNGQIVNGDSLNISLDTDANSKSNVGKYPIIATPSNENYSIKVNNGEIIIKPLAVNIEITNQNGTYGESPKLQTLYNVNNLVNDDILDIVLKTNASSNSPAYLDGVQCEYDITLDEENSINPNYILNVTKIGKYTFSRRAISIKIEQTSQYGEEVCLDNNDYTVTSAKKVVNNDSLNLELVTSADSTSDKGEYEIEVRLDNANENYIITVESAVLTITPRVLYIEIDPQSSIFGEKVSLDQTKFKITEGSIVNNDEMNFVLSTDATNSSPVGEYNIMLRWDDNENYDIDYTKGIYTISLKNITVTIGNTTSIYGDTPSLDKVTYTFEETIAEDIDITLKTNATHESGVGDYDIDLDYTSDNYTLEVVLGVLTITPRDVSLVIGNQNGVYGDKHTLDNNNYTAFGLVNNDTLIVYLSTDIFERTSIGEYPIILDEEKSINPNYTIDVTNGKYIINPKAISIQISQSTTYGEEVKLDNNDFTVSSGNILDGDSLNLAFTSLANRTSPVGKYDISVDKTNANKNYDITVVSAHMFIEKRDIVISINDATSTYGYDIRCNGYLVLDGSVVNSDNLGTISTTAIATSSVGKYEITISNTNGNYNVTATNGEYTITPRLISVRKNQEIVYGEEILFDDTYILTSGVLVGEDDLDITFSTTVKVGDDVGKYNIGLNSGNANYKVTNDDSILTITPREIEIVVEETTIYGNAVILNNNSYRVISGTIYNEDNLELILSSVVNERTTVGKYDIVVTYNNANYDLECNIATLEVLPRGIILELDTQSSIYGEEVSLNQMGYTLTSASSVVNNDVVNITLTTNATQYSPVGKYNITANTDNENYNLIYNSGNYEILKRNIKIKLHDQKMKHLIGFDFDDSKYTILEGSLVNNDTLNLEMYSNANQFYFPGEYELYANNLSANYEVDIEKAKLYLEVSFVDIIIVAVLAVAIVVVVIVLIKKVKAKKKNKELFDKYIGW